MDRLRLVFLFVLGVLVVGCGASTPDDDASTRATLTGDSPLVETFQKAEDETGVPAEVLATVAFVQTRFSMNRYSTEELGHAPRELGLMAIGTGGKVDVDSAAKLAGLPSSVVATDPSANVRAAALWLAAEAKRQGLMPLSAEGWRPVVEAYGGEELGLEVLRRLRLGFEAQDDDGLGIELQVDGPEDVLGQVAQSLGYPGAKWNPAYSGNYTNANRGASQINYIVIHTTQGSYAGTVSWFKNPAAKVSSHYVVRSSDGEITQMVDDRDIAWHDACFNSNSIGIEHEGYVQDPGKWYTEAMYQASAKLTAWLCDKYGIPKDRKHIMGHGEAPDCSDHTDPGSGWNWNHYMDLVKNGACKPSTEVCNGKDDDCDGSVDEGDVCLIEQVIVPQMGTLNGSPSSDLDGDGKADVCARASKGLLCSTSGSGFKGTLLGPELTNASGWDKPQYFGTLRMGDVNGDGKADVCARAAAGVSCWLSDGNGFPDKIAGPKWSNADGWDDIKYWSTLRLADVNGDGKADLCARSATDFRCHLSKGDGFGAAITGPALSDAKGWGHDRYYGTIRMGDVNGDGKADVCARGSGGVSCWLSDGAGFPDKIDGPTLTDANSWDGVQYWSTLRMADVNGDGKADLCARAAAGLRCWLSDGTSVTDKIDGPELSNAKGWNKPEYYSTLRFGDLNRDGKADVCARAAAGLRCWLSDGKGFPEQVTSDELSDKKGWNKPEYYSTLRLADDSGDGRADVCGRGIAGVFCWEFDGKAFSPPVTGPAWKDESGWNKIMYYSTLQAAGGCVASEEVCNQADDDCDGEVDEDDVCGGWNDGGVVGAAGAGGGAGAGGSPSGATPPALAPDESGCGCRTPRSPVGGGLPLFLALALGGSLWLRRRSAGANQPQDDEPYQA
ncbi:MAG: VCBS repeat-containing protein [Myxococcales bacterium]|nr:VCBS repeat-containing protein [Myxococcales bacterium]MCB9581249.1 VCBS repeat-containing protein [Polyangiaceae bacterium]